MAHHRAAVLGDPVAHSLSPVLHTAGYQACGLVDWTYERIVADAAGVAKLMRDADPSYTGFSVTMPGKFAALEHADTASERATLLGSANTLVRRDGGWFADNTDTEGVLGALSQLLGPTNTDGPALIVGAGGTARPALWAIAQRGVREVVVLNRSDRSQELGPLVDALGLKARYVGMDRAEDHARQAAFIVSTVPSAGVEGVVDKLAHAPILDVIYHPRPTRLIAEAVRNGHSTVSGEVMLAYQAYPQFEAFTGVAAPRETMFEALSRHLD